MWLEALNVQRKAEEVEAIKPAIFEVTITQIEKEWHALEKRKSSRSLRHSHHALTI
jgi:NuA3 HAT complex component NTO1